MVFRSAKRVALAAGALALTVMLPGMALTGVRPASNIASKGTVVAAQSAAPSSLEQLQLTDQQRQKIWTLRKERNREIAKVLNETQRKKLVQSLKSGIKLGAALQTLNLSADQKQKITAIVQKSTQEMKATLTDKQRQQLETMRKQHQTTAQIPID
ncbi:MAG: hypothetical protein ACAF41_26460 [Leptolyngbya sp. BL-A-14]